MLGIDTNILLRWLVDESFWPVDDPEQWAAVRRLLGDRTRNFYLNLIVLAETIWVIERRFKPRAAAVVEMLEQLYGSTNVTLQDREAVISASAAHSRGRPGLNVRLIAEIDKRAGLRSDPDLRRGRQPDARLPPARAGRLTSSSLSRRQ